MWKNSDNPSFPWKLRRVSADGHLSESYDGLLRDSGENMKYLKLLLAADQPLRPIHGRLFAAIVSGMAKEVRRRRTQQKGRAKPVGNLFYYSSIDLTYRLKLYKSYKNLWHLQAVTFASFP